MTGYGRGENIRNGRKFTVEIKSVNHRYNDITIKLPRSMNYMEDTIRKKLTTQIARGKTDVYIFFETTSSEDVKIDLNEALTDAYVKQLEQIKARYNLKDDISLSLISRFPDILTVEKMDIDNDAMLDILMPAIDMALNELLALRKKEGLALKEDILLKLDKINGLVESIKLRSPIVVLDYRDKLKAKLKELLDNKDIDEGRLITEVTLFADRASVDEEITRLFSHINQVREILNEKEAIGRKLDFLIQEMNREANTIGSKSNDIEITQTTVNLKSEIEKIREQVQNIE
jgi:uncharacterized protein (TIGR00255 family)